MIFTKAQINEILQTIDAHTKYLIGLNLGYNVLSQKDLTLLRVHGLDVNKLKVDWPPYVQAYMFGRLAALLSKNQLQSISYNDFINYLKKEQFIPLSPREKAEYEIAREKTYSHITSLGERIQSETKSFIYNTDMATFADQERVLKQEIESAVLARKQIKTIVSDIAKKMGTWSIDWGRIVDTEMQDIFNRGVAQSIQSRFGINQKVYKDTFGGACRYCIKLHLTGGIGSEPILFTLDELYANGSNVGKKKEDWKATVGPEHPFCRCHIMYVLPDQEWNTKSKSYVTKKMDGKTKRKTKVKIFVNDKVFVI